MKKVLSMIVVAGVLGLSPSVSHSANEPDYGMPDQSMLDAPSGQMATWANLAGGVTARPYVTKLSVINAGVETKVIENGTPTTPAPAAGGLALAISAFNLCKTGQTPAQGVCYATPNRIGVAVGYQIQPGQLGYNFASPKVPLLTPVTADTEFDITLALNTLGKTLRWTWANGVPTQWGITDIGADSAVLRIRLKPGLAPVTGNGGGCSQVPVMACEFTTASNAYLGANLVLSLDTTLDPIFTGALFSSTRSYMGSMSTMSGGGSGGGSGSQNDGASGAPANENQMSYGVSAPSTWFDGTANASSFSAVISDAALLNFFGATPDVTSTTEFQASALNLTRTDGGSQGTPVWTRWSATAQGTDGWLITIPGITFAAAPAGSSVRSAAGRVAPANVKVSTKVAAPSTQVKMAGKAATVVVRGKVAPCKASVCRVVISSIGSKTSTKATKVGSVTLRKSSSVVASVRVAGGKIAKGARLSVAVQAKKGAKWQYVTSGVVTVG